MLKSISPLLGPELLRILAAMGHGDEIAIVDANYPGTSSGPEILRMEGLTATDILDAVLTVFPLDDFVDEAAVCMAVVGEPDRREPIMEEFQQIIDHREPGNKLATLERFAFYDRVSSGFAVVQSGERRLYGNIILKKGVVRPD